MNKELLMKQLNELYSNQVGKLFCEEEIRKAIDKHINKHCYDCDIEEQTNNLLKELFGEK
jgi:hypothetical protein